MSKSIYLGFNWKVNPETLSEASNLLQTYTELKADFDYDIFVPFVFLGSLQGKGVSVGSQDVSANGSGAFTGQITAKMLKGMNVKSALIGHSETRVENSLSHETLNKKISKCLEEGVVPVICTAFHSSQTAESELTSDLTATLNNIKKDSELVIAFEPLESIGGIAMSTDKVDFYLGFIKKLLSELGFTKTKVLYGGGVNSKNVTELLNCPNLDGCLIGGASLKTDELKSIFELTNQFLSTK
jgi:triosephosphate isomerase (TIM)